MAINVNLKLLNVLPPTPFRRFRHGKQRIFFPQRPPISLRIRRLNNRNLRCINRKPYQNPIWTFRFSSLCKIFSKWTTFSIRILPITFLLKGVKRITFQIPFRPFFRCKKYIIFSKRKPINIRIRRLHNQCLKCLKWINHQKNLNSFSL